MSEPRTFIYRDTREWLHSYTVVADEPWPFGRIVGIAMTLRGARRIARREKAKIAAGIPERVLVK